MTNLHDSNELLSHLEIIKDKGEHTVQLGFLLGTSNRSLIAIEPVITSLQSIDAMKIHFEFDGDKVLTMEATDHSVLFSFELKF